MKDKKCITAFRTADMPLITYLRYHDCVVQKIEKLTDYKAEFIFESVDRELLETFNTDKGLVEPRRFAAIMHQQMQSAKRTLNE